MNPRGRLVYLLDVNILVALFDGAHVHHDAAHAWFERKGRRGWASCPLTENGFLRILSHPAYPNSPTPISDLAERLEEFKKAPGNQHYFLESGYSFSQWVLESGLKISSAQSTDVYLLGLCQRNHAVLATFDLRIRPEWIGEKKNDWLEWIPF